VSGTADGREDAGKLAFYLLYPPMTMPPLSK